MALERWVLTRVEAFEANADLSAKQHFLMKMSAEDTVDVAGAGGKVIGILLNAPAAAGRGAAVLTDGQGMVVAGGTIAVDDYIKADSAGKGVAATSAGNEVCGRALSAAASGEEFAMELMFFRY